MRFKVTNFRLNYSLKFNNCKLTVIDINLYYQSNFCYALFTDKNFVTGLIK